MDRQVLGDISSSRSTHAAPSATTENTIDIPDSFLSPPPVDLYNPPVLDLHSSLQEYGNLKRKLNLAEAQFQLHQNNIVSIDSDNEDENVPGSFETPPKTPKQCQKKSATSISVQSDKIDENMTPKAPPKPKKQRVQRKPKSVPLSTQLGGLTTKQLIDMVTQFVDKYPEQEQKICELIPTPDLTAMEQRLDYLHHNIYKSFPYTRWGSSRDSFCYKRVKTHLDAFKKECIEKGKTLMDSESWEAVINYVLLAWKFVDKMPNWDNPAHNAQKNQCFKTLATQCKKALKKSCLEKELYHDIKSRLEVAEEADSVMQSCVEEVNTILKKLS